MFMQVFNFARGSGRGSKEGQRKGGENSQDNQFTTNE